MEWVFTYKSIYNYYEPKFASRYVPEFASLRAVLPRLSFSRVIQNLSSHPSLALVSQQDSLPSPRKISTCLTQWVHRQNQPFVSLWINLRNRINCSAISNLFPRTPFWVSMALSPAPGHKQAVGRLLGGSSDSAGWGILENHLFHGEI